MHEQHSQIEGELLENTQWCRECLNDGITAGSYYSVEGSGRGQCSFVHKRIVLSCEHTSACISSSYEMN